MKVTHEAYPIAPRDGVRCRRCKTRPAQYRAVRVGAHPHTLAAKYRCVGCIADEGGYRIMGPEKPPKPPTEIAPRVRLSPFERRREEEMERLKAWTGAASSAEPTP